MRDLSGQTFGSYRLEELLGRGGMGEVYSARHLRLTNRHAAVKVLPSSLATEPDFLRRFEQEAISAASLDHPNILPVWDYGEQDGQPYLAMPLVTGGSLKELLEQHGSLSLADAERYLTPIADALDYAHERGIIHRDVKPANILLRDDGRPLLADFGIAKAIEAGQTQGLTRAGTGVGTPEYMAPEQIEGRAERRSDLYSLGVVLYEMLTGRVPYDGATPYEIAYKQIYTPLPPISQVRAGLPPAIEQMLNKALAKDPAQRYSTGADLVAAYRAARDGNAPADTVIAPAPRPVHDQRTGPLIITPGATAELPSAPRAQPPAAYTPAPAVYQQPQPAYYQPPAQPLPPPRQPARQQPNTNRWPLVLAGTIAVLLVLCIGSLGAYAAFGRDRATPTPTPDLAATQAVQAAATGTANAAASGTQAANAAASATTQAQTAANAAATQAAGTTATAQATAVVQATAAAQATVVAQATAAAQAATANAAATQAAGATAAAQATAAVQATAVTNATATANSIVAQTATAAAQPTVAPTTAPTAAPTKASTAVPTALGGWGPVLKPLSGGKAYSDPQKRFSFSVPQDWKQDTSTSSAVAFAPANGAANFNVELEDVPANTTLDAYNTAAEKQLKSQFSDYTLVSLTKVIVDDHAAYKRVSKVTYQGQAIEIEQVYFLNNTTANIMTFAALPENFDGQAATFDGIAGSYKALK
jgi:eukaryotic-like serine/threonine-protein kinase